MNGSLAAVAWGQGGPFLVTQALAAGYRKREVVRLVDSGEWTRLRRGVLVESRLLEGGRGDEGKRRDEVRVAGVVLALGPGAVCSHESAALLHGLPLLGRSPREVRVTRADARGRGRPVGVRVFRADLPAGHVARVRGVPVTAVARTAVDLARVLPGEAARVVAVDAAMYHGKVGRGGLEAVLRDCAGWPGATRAAVAVAAARPRVRSPLETLGRLMCVAAGLPEPETGVLIGETGEDGGTGEPYTEADLYWRAYRVIVLLDGMFKYGVAGRLRAEKLKQERLEQDGFVVVRLSWQDVVEDAERSVARIRAAFRRSSRRIRST